MAGRRRVRPDDDGAAVADAPQVRLTPARQQAAVGAVTGVAQTVANGPAADAAGAAASAKLQQTEHEADAVRKLAEEYPDALVVEAADFGKHGIAAPALRVALICRACVRVRANKAEFKDDRRQAKVYVARRFAEEAAAHFDTCFSRNLEREYAMREAAGVSPSPTPPRGQACSRPQQQRQQQEKLLARLSYWFVEHNVSLMAVSQFGKEIGSQLGELLPLNVDWSRRLHAAAKESYAAMLARTIEMPYTCLAFDGGKWQHTGQHVLICVAANPNGVMVLPPVTQESAWTAESTAKVVSQHRMALQGTTIKHAVVDGAAYNGAAVDGMNILAEFIHELGDDPMSAHVPGLTPHEKDFVDAMGTALRGASYGCIKQVLCLGHWVKNRVVQAQDKNAASYQFLLNIERSLYGGEEDQSTRRTSLTSRIRAIRARVKEDGIAAIDEAIAAINALLNPRTLVVTLQWRSAVANQVRQALKTPAKVVVADADGAEVAEPGAAQAAPVGVEAGPAAARAPGTIDPAAGVGFDDESEEDKLLWTLQTGTNWKDEAIKLRSILTELRAVAEGESTAARTATVNQTRWHTSTYLAYVFAAQNLPYLRLFYNRQASAPQSVKDIRADLADATKSAQIERELVEYTVSMAPASRFLQAASENSPGLVMRMWPLFRTLCDKLLLQPENSVGRRCGDVIESFLNFDIGSVKDEFTRTVGFFMHAHLLVPGVFITLAESFLAKLNFSVRKVRFHLGFTEEELPEAEWEGFLNFQRLQKVPCDTLSFWQGPSSEKWPQLRKIALYLYYAPAVVTTCDSIISVMGNMFSTRQTRLAESTAADLVAWRCNGHPDHNVDGSIRRSTTPMS